MAINRTYFQRKNNWHDVAWCCGYNAKAVTGATMKEAEILFEQWYRPVSKAGVLIRPLSLENYLNRENCSSIRPQWWHSQHDRMAQMTIIKLRTSRSMRVDNKSSMDLKLLAEWSPQTIILIVWKKSIDDEELNCLWFGYLYAAGTPLRLLRRRCMGDCKVNDVVRIYIPEILSITKMHMAFTTTKYRKYLYATANVSYRFKTKFMKCVCSWHLLFSGS